MPAGVWSTGTGSKIYYNGGKVGIGTSTPNYKLDVDGDMRVTQNLYLQGELVISEKIVTPKQMKSRSIVTDSIIMDSTKAVYGVTNFKDEVKLANKLSVNGSATIGGDLKTMGSLTFAGDKKISYTAGTSTTPSIFSFGVAPRPPGPCYLSPVTISLTQFPGLIESYDLPTGSTANVMTMGFDGANGIVDVAGPTSKLLINKNCGHDVEISTGTLGGNVSIGAGNGGNIDMLSGTNGNMTIGSGANNGSITLASGNNSGNVSISSGALSKVGIGTISPIAKFEIQNNNPSIITACISKVESATQTRRMIFEPKLNAGDYNAITLAGDAGLFWSDGAGGAGTNTDAGFVLASWPSTLNAFNGMRINSKGAIGIGISNPEGMVHIQNDKSRTLSGPLRIGLKITNDIPLAENQEAVVGILSEVTFDISKTISTGKTVGTTYTENFAVYGDGHVFARDIKVTLQTPFVHPDYVFEKNYKLKTLEEIESFIKQNGHLPEVPSACDVERNNGINLGEMSEKQLEKIEELTLYIIELNKRMNELAKTIEVQNQKIELLKK